jgi:hypothetical protein
VLVTDTSEKYQMTKDSLFEIGALKTKLQYLPYKEFEYFKANLFNTLYNSNFLIADQNLKIAASRQEKRDVYVLCDSIKFDDKSPAVFMCDSNTRINTVSAIEFYERWSLDTLSGQIKKEFLASAPLYFNYNLNVYKPSFYLFKNKEAYEQIKSQINLSK